jgi:hypothetical protein
MVLRALICLLHSAKRLTDRGLLPLLELDVGEDALVEAGDANDDCLAILSSSVSWIAVEG